MTDKTPNAPLVAVSVAVPTCASTAVGRQVRRATNAAINRGNHHRHTGARYRPPLIAAFVAVVLGRPSGVGLARIATGDAALGHGLGECIVEPSSKRPLRGSADR